MIKLFVFAERRAEVAPGEFWTAWRSALTGLLAGEAGRPVRRAIENRTIASPAVPGFAAPAFDGVFELSFDAPGELESVLAGEGWAAAIAGLAGGPATPSARAIVIAAEESVQFDRGTVGAVKFMALSRRSARFASREDWIRYWVDVHGPLAHGIPEFTRYYHRYVHNYVVPCERASGGRDPQFDGIVEEWVDSVESFARCLEEPKYLEIVRPDELLFVDFARSHVMLAHEHVMLER
jgi:hypothetical protein